MSIKKINGYKILLGNFLGEGTFGVVYKGEQDGTNKQCAIKIIDKKKIGSDQYLKSALFSQIQIMSKLNSPNIVGFQEVLESSNNYYIVQQLCSSDLEKQLERQPQKKFPQKQATEILFQICNGFLTLAKEGIVHRDLKPANILVHNGVIKIGDFGFAKQNLHKKVKNQSCVGTPVYMPIEILKGLPYTSKCDIWAVGCIFYQLLHGITPFTGKTQFQLVQRIQKGVYEIDPKLSDVTKNFIEHCLKTYEQDRICWDDLFKHAIFKGYFNKYLDENQQLENTYKKVMGDLRFKINSGNIDLKKFWASLGYEKNKDLSFQEFQNFMQTINPNISQVQELYFFEKMDANGDGSVSLIQLEEELKKNSISLTSKYGNKIPLQVRKTTSISQNDIDSNRAIKWDEQFQKKVRNCFTRLNRIIESKKLTLYKTFIAYDSDNKGVLSFAQFSKILKKLDNSFTNDEMQAVFDLVDQDNSNTVQFDELNAYYCKVNCIPINMYLPQEKKKKMGCQMKENQVKKKAL